jgi:MoxR-like ATPase
VTGVSIYNQATGQFEFRPGPVVAQVVLADEINRATPKTQSALLESMEEKRRRSLIASYCASAWAILRRATSC